MEASTAVDGYPTSGFTVMPTAAGGAVVLAVGGEIDTTNSRASGDHDQPRWPPCRLPGWSWSI
ncbi:hypothetical protein [Amycolatopsis sp. NPDC051903]|uniref:hypothetical protein n=1 Tax=Amycolatopsis sp. NPDC051903 TaxID=3363936 RepID=UPI003794B336